MPEIPEIETLKKQVLQHLVGKRVVALLARPAIKPRLGSEETCNALAGTTVSGADRRGKMLILKFDDRLALVIHLMLHGQLLLTSGDDFDFAQSHMGITFDDTSCLEFRQFGLRLPRLLPMGDLETLPELAKLGIDALSPELTLERFQRLLEGRRGAIKVLLQDQSLIAGLGNTYTNEILHAAHVLPDRDARTLSPEDLATIYQSIRPALQRGLELGGSSAESFLHLDGTPGHFHEHAQVFRRNGQPCHTCGTAIQRTEVGGRSSFFCPKCQK